MQCNGWEINLLMEKIKKEWLSSELTHVIDFYMIQGKFLICCWAALYNCQNDEWPASYDASTSLIWHTQPKEQSLELQKNA